MDGWTDGWLNGSDLRSCVTVDVNVLGSPVRTVHTICGRKATLEKKKKLNGCRYGSMDWFTGRGIGPFSLKNIHEGGHVESRNRKRDWTQY